MSTDLVTHNSGALTATPSVSEVARRAEACRAIVDSVMKEDLHYGKIPGTPKKSLWQPGAEKLAMAFQLAPSYAVEELMDDDPTSKQYRVICTVSHDGFPVSQGVGEASTNEEKYKWRKAVCDEEWEETDPDRRRKKWKKWKGKAEQVLQVRTEAADLCNTVIKMASKRAFVAAVRSATAASDIFEDFDITVPEEQPRYPDIERPQARKSSPAQTSSVDTSSKPPTQDKGGASQRPTSGREIPEEAWESVQSRMHTKGVLSDSQVRRFFAIATKNGWSGDEAEALVRAEFGIPITEFPWGDPYDALCAIFEGFAPAD